jgi:hypothetical protein
MKAAQFLSKYGAIFLFGISLVVVAGIIVWMVLKISKTPPGGSCKSPSTLCNGRCITCSGVRKLNPNTCECDICDTEQAVMCGSKCVAPCGLNETMDATTCECECNPPLIKVPATDKCEKQIACDPSVNKTTGVIGGTFTDPHNNACTTACANDTIPTCNQVCVQNGFDEYRGLDNGLKKCGNKIDCSARFVTQQDCKDGSHMSVKACQSSTTVDLLPPAEGQTGILQVPYAQKGDFECSWPDEKTWQSTCNALVSSRDGSSYAWFNGQCLNISPGKMFVRVNNELNKGSRTSSPIDVDARDAIPEIPCKNGAVNVTLAVEWTDMIQTIVESWKNIEFEYTFQVVDMISLCQRRDCQQYTSDRQPGTEYIYRPAQASWPSTRPIKICKKSQDTPFCLPSTFPTKTLHIAHTIDFEAAAQTPSGGKSILPFFDAGDNMYKTTLYVALTSIKATFTPENHTRPLMTWDLLNPIGTAPSATALPTSMIVVLPPRGVYQSPGVRPPSDRVPRWNWQLATTIASNRGRSLDNLVKDPKWKKTKDGANGTPVPVLPSLNVQQAILVVPLTTELYTTSALEVNEMLVILAWGSENLNAPSSPPSTCMFADSREAPQLWVALYRSNSNNLGVYTEIFNKPASDAPEVWVAFLQVGGTYTYKLITYFAAQRQSMAIDSYTCRSRSLTGTVTVPLYTTPLCARIPVGHFNPKSTQWPPVPWSQNGICTWAEADKTGAQTQVGSVGENAFADFCCLFNIRTAKDFDNKMTLGAGLSDLQLTGQGSQGSVGCGNLTAPSGSFSQNKDTKGFRKLFATGALTNSACTGGDTTGDDTKREYICPLWYKIDQTPIACTDSTCSNLKTRMQNVSDWATEQTLPNQDFADSVDTIQERFRVQFVNACPPLRRALKDNHYVGNKFKLSDSSVESHWGLYQCEPVPTPQHNLFDQCIQWTQAAGVAGICEASKIHNTGTLEYNDCTPIKGNDGKNGAPNSVLQPWQCEINQKTSPQQWQCAQTRSVFASYEDGGANGTWFDPSPCCNAAVTNQTSKEGVWTPPVVQGLGPEATVTPGSCELKAVMPLHEKYCTPGMHDPDIESNASYCENIQSNGKRRTGFQNSVCCNVLSSVCTKENDGTGTCICNENYEGEWCQHLKTQKTPDGLAALQAAGCSKDCQLDASRDYTTKPALGECVWTDSLTAGKATCQCTTPDKAWTKTNGGEWRSGKVGVQVPFDVDATSTEWYKQDANTCAYTINDGVEMSLNRPNQWKEFSSPWGDNGCMSLGEMIPCTSNGHCYKTTDMTRYTCGASVIKTPLGCARLGAHKCKSEGGSCTTIRNDDGGNSNSATIKGWVDLQGNGKDPFQHSVSLKNDPKSSLDDCNGKNPGKCCYVQQTRMAGIGNTPSCPSGTYYTGLWEGSSVLGTGHFNYLCSPDGAEHHMGADTSI